MKKNTGFTLLEILVALTILSMLLIMVSGLFSRFITTQRRDLAELSLQEDVRSAMEFMSREIDTGYGSTFAVTGAEGTGFIFRNQDGQCVEYRGLGGQVQRAVASAGVGQECDGAQFSSFTNVTGAQTNVTLRFETPRDIRKSGVLIRQGFVTVLVHAISASNAAALPLDMETTITSRQIQAYE